MILVPDWEAAECRRLDIPTRVFFYEDDYERSSVAYGEAREMARSICLLCPIRVACGEYATATNQAGGMWGGLTPVERRAERRRIYHIALVTLERSTLQGFIRPVHDGPIHRRRSRA